MTSVPSRRCAQMTDESTSWAECTWEGADRRQRRLGLSLTPAERLQWLEESLEWIHRVHALNGVGARGRPENDGEDVQTPAGPDPSRVEAPTEREGRLPSVSACISGTTRPVRSAEHGLIREEKAPSMSADDERRARRAEERRRSWASELTTLDGHSNHSVASPEAALSAMWGLAQQAWALSGRAFPTYSRATMPGALLALSAPESPEQ